MRRFAILILGTVTVLFALGVPAATAAAKGTSADTSSKRSAVHPHGRFGIFPTKEAHDAHPIKAGSGQLKYGGGVDGIGVTTGAPKVYLVFWGSQWGTSSTGTDGYLHLSNDTKGMAPRQQAFFKGVGTNSEQWSGVVTQYCEGVATGATTCPASAPHVGYPTGGALAGVWADTASATPSQSTQAQLAAEAVKAAAHFGNTTAASNRNAEYVVTSPSGTHPDGFNTITANWCAWHDYTTSSYGDIAYTNMPYITDMGTSCGQNFVNSGSAGTLDGVTIVGGHEYAETITDQNPAGGWTDTTGYENADKCAWISSGNGASQNITLSTGTFAIQSSWGNDYNGGAGGCEVYHAIVSNNPDFTISASPSALTVAQGSSGTSTISTSASNGFNSSVSLSASGLPSGASASFSPNPIAAPGSGSSTMTITVGSATTAGTYTVTVTGTGGSTSHSTTVSLTVGSGGGGGSQLLGNPGFETGSASPWVATSGVISNSASEPPHGGSWDAWLDGYGTSHTDSLYQQVTIPSTVSSATLTFWLHIDTAETTTSTAYDTLKVQIRNSSNTVLATLATYSNLNKASGYSQKSFSLTSYKGQTIRVYLLGVEDASLQTSFVADDFALNTA